jgi:hypothetical protein
LKATVTRHLIAIERQSTPLIGECFDGVQCECQSRSGQHRAIDGLFEDPICQRTRLIAFKYQISGFNTKPRLKVHIELKFAFYVLPLSRLTDQKPGTSFHVAGRQLL